MWLLAAILDSIVRDKPTNDFESLHPAPSPNIHITTYTQKEALKMKNLVVKAWKGHLTSVCLLTWGIFLSLSLSVSLCLFL
jgi:hypothetical protein